jgi:hypothetical protein
MECVLQFISLQRIKKNACHEGLHRLKLSVFFFVLFFYFARQRQNFSVIIDQRWVIHPHCSPLDMTSCEQIHFTRIFMEDLY